MEELQTEVKRGRGRPRVRPLPDPNAPKRGRGRQCKSDGVFRVNLGCYVTAEQEDWLNEVKAKTGKSWGEIIDSIIERYRDGE